MAYLNLLERWQLTIDGQPLALPHSVQRLVAFVALNGSLPRGLVAARVWPDGTEEHAQGSLRSAVWRLQSRCPHLLEDSGGNLALQPGIGVDVADLVSAAEALLNGASPGAVAPSVPLLRQELLPGWYDDWILFERERLRQLRLHALETLAMRLAEAGSFGSALQAALAASAAEPLRESAQRAIIRIHLMEGNHVEALRAYEAFRALLSRELDIEPSVLMRSLLGEVCSGPKR